MSLYKGKGDTPLLDFYRSILLNNCLPKHHHALMRVKTVQHHMQLLRLTQYGGVPGLSTAHATLSLKLYLQLCEQRKRSAIVPLVDLKQAFYSMVR